MFTDDFISKACVLMNKALAASVADKEHLMRVEEWSLEVLYLKNMKNGKVAEKDGSRQKFYELVKKHDVGVKPDFRFVEQ